MSQDFSQFPTEQRAAYLGAIASLTTADREASRQEVAFLSGLAQQTGLSQEQAQAVVDAALDPQTGALQKNLAVLKNSDLRFSLLHDLLAYAQSDGNFSPEEQKSVESLASALGISQGQFQAVDNFQHAQATRGDISGAANALRNAGVPAQSTGFLGELIGTLGPIVLQQVLARAGRGGSGAGAGGLAGVLGALGGNAPGGSSGGGLTDILGAVLGGAQGGGRPTSSGGLADVLGAVLGGAGGRQTAPPSSGFGGLGQILQVLGSAGDGQQRQPFPAGRSQTSGDDLADIASTLGRLFGGR
ncbi:MAG TPA: tellurite resistance TerB family protein [Chthoniobacterales bacterium]